MDQTAKDAVKKIVVLKAQAEQLRAELAAVNVEITRLKDVISGYMKQNEVDVIHNSSVANLAPLPVVPVDRSSMVANLPPRPTFPPESGKMEIRTRTAKRKPPLNPALIETTLSEWCSLNGVQLNVASFLEYLCSYRKEHQIAADSVRFIRPRGFPKPKYVVAEERLVENLPVAVTGEPVRSQVNYVDLV